MLERGIPLTDYYSILSRAVASLDPNTAQARDQLFERARRMLLTQIQNDRARWTDAQAEAEIANFDAATDRIESEIARRTTQRVDRTLSAASAGRSRRGRGARPLPG